MNKRNKFDRKNSELLNLFSETIEGENNKNPEKMIDQNSIYNIDFDIDMKEFIEYLSYSLIERQ